MAKGNMLLFVSGFLLAASLAFAVAAVFEFTEGPCKRHLYAANSWRSAAHMCALATCEACNPGGSADEILRWHREHLPQH